MAASKHFVEFAAGEQIFRENDSGSEMYIIEQGQVEIVKEVRGHERHLATLSEGDFFGEMSILEELPRTATAKAKSDCRLLRIDQDVFDQVLAQRPEIAVRMLHKLSKRLREFYRASEQSGRLKRHLIQTKVPSACFVAERGNREFPLGPGDETTVGRIDTVTGRTPEIDLTEVDEHSSVSRFHATIVRQDGRFYVCDPVPSANGTFVRGTRLQGRELAEIEDGTEVRFGGVVTCFQMR